MSVCRQWRHLGSEFLYRCVYFSNTMRLISLCTSLDNSSSVSTTTTSSHGWWTRRIHLTADHRSLRNTPSDRELEKALVSIIRHCPNVEIFVIEQPLGSAFGPVIDALATHAFRNLHTVCWTIPGAGLAKVIWAFNSLPHIVAAHVGVDTAVPANQEIAHLGSASDLHLKLPYLQQLSLSGYVHQLSEQVAGWDLPSLRSFSISTPTTEEHDRPDIEEFLKHHGPSLLLLDLNLKLDVDVPVMLDLCPNLVTFTFNADWPIRRHPPSLVNRPHRRITTIGLYGLTHAFGVRSTGAMGITRYNDSNIAALNRSNFPQLQRIRALSRSMLKDLNDENGPSTVNGGYERWNKWWNACAGAGIRLEDCTGQTLGTLPPEEGSEDDSGGEEDDSESEIGDEDEDDLEDGEEEEEDSDEWGSALEDEADYPLQVPVALSELLQEVRAMNEGRDEALINRVRIPRPQSPWGS